MRLSAAVLVPALVALLSGCAFGHRFWAVKPGVDQVIRVQSGDRVYFEMEEGAADGIWDFTCDDPDVAVSIDHERKDAAAGLAKVVIRIHRGYDGPSTVTFAQKRPGAKTPQKSFAVTLFRRTGDAAFWR